LSKSRQHKPDIKPLDIYQNTDL